MATETYKYFKPDPNLRPEYGGGTPQFLGDSREVYAKDYAHRYVSKMLGYPNINGTRYLWEVGTATDTFVWIKVPDLLWAVISPKLTATELGTAQSTPPAGFSKTSLVSVLQPSATRKVLMVRSMSILAGLGTTTGDTRDTWPAQLIASITGQSFTWADPAFTEGVTELYYLGNMSLGGSTWANTVPDSAGDPSGQASYPRREDLAFRQRTQTLPLFGRRLLFLYSLGTNDLAYDLTLSPADCWARVVARIAAFRAEFPNIKLALETVYKRGSSTPLNDRIAAFNALMRANYQSIGVDYLFDSEAKVPQLNVSTGNTKDTLIYTDETHLTTYAHSLVAAAHKQQMIDALNAA